MAAYSCDLGHRVKLGFNPCSGGLEMAALAGVPARFDIGCFNPCSGGLEMAAPLPNTRLT